MDTTPRIVRLNVGGTLLETTLTTLTSVKDSVLATMFSSSWHTDNDQIRFIDTDPTIFAAILQGLRRGGVDDAFRPTNVGQEAWERKLDFWGLPKPIVVPDPDPRGEAIDKLIQSVGKPGGLAKLDEYGKIPEDAMRILDDEGRVHDYRLPEVFYKLVAFMESANEPNGPALLDSACEIPSWMIKGPAQYF